MWAAVGTMGYGELLRPGRNQRPTGSPEDAGVTHLDLRRQQGVTPLPVWTMLCQPSSVQAELLSERRACQGTFLCL